jgi:hypothetical protein
MKTTKKTTTKNTPLFLRLEVRPEVLAEARSEKVLTFDSECCWINGKRFAVNALATMTDPKTKRKLVLIDPKPWAGGENEIQAR